MNVRSILLRHIRVDGGTQSRVELDQSAVEDYTEKMASGASFPAVVVFEDHVSNLLWLGDGFHRVAAAEACGKKNIKAEVREGGLREAKLYATGANGKHGVRPTIADKRKSVSTLLDDPEWCKWSDNQIAKHVEVSQPFVSKMRAARANNVITPAPAPAAPNRVLDAMEDLMDEGDRPSGPERLNDPSKPQALPERPDPIKAAPLGQDQSLVPVTSEERARLAQLERLVLEKDEQLAATQELMSGIESDQETIASLIRVVDAGGNLKAMMAENKRLMEDARICRARLAGAMSTINENKGWVKFWKDRHDGLIKKVQKTREKFDASGDRDAFISEVIKALEAATKPNPKAKACDEAMTAITTEEAEYVAAFGEEPQ